MKPIQILRPVQWLLPLAALGFGTMAAAQDGSLMAAMKDQGAITEAQAQAASRAAFAKLDANHDGVVSEAEFVDARMQLFHAADTNGDGQVTRAEARAMLLSRADR